MFLDFVVLHALREADAKKSEKLEEEVRQWDQSVNRRLSRFVGAVGSLDCMTNLQTTRQGEGLVALMHCSEMFSNWF